MKWRCRSVTLVLVELFKLGDAAHDQKVPIFGAPNRDRRSPVAVPADVPVSGTFEPFAKASIFEVFGSPMDLCVGLEAWSF